MNNLNEYDVIEQTAQEASELNRGILAFVIPYVITSTAVVRLFALGFEAGQSQHEGVHN